MRPPGMQGPSGLSDNPMMKQMMQQAMDFMKSLPEPYSSFMMKNVMLMPQNIKQKLFMSLMRQNPSKAPKLIDTILAEFNYAVPGTDNANNHPEFKTSFKGATTKSERDNASTFPTLPPEAILQMSKFLEKNLKSKVMIQSSGSEMGEGGGMMGGGMPRMSPQSMVRMLANTKINRDT